MAMNRTRRKLAISSWSAPSSPAIFGKLEVEVTEAIKLIDHLRKTTGVKVTMTHVVGRILAAAMARSPGLNGRILWGKYVPHDQVDIAFLVALEDGADLGNYKVENADQKDIVTIANELRAGATKLVKGEDEEFKKSMGALKILPTFLIRPLIWFTGWLASSLGVSIPALGVRKFPFGSAMITSVGMFGLDEAYAPFTPWARVPVLVLIGAVKDRAQVVDGKLTSRPMMTISATIDHRFVDGKDAARLAKTARKLFANPWPLAGLDKAPADEGLPEKVRAEKVR